MHLHPYVLISNSNASTAIFLNANTNFFHQPSDIWKHFEFEFKNQEYCCRRVFEFEFKNASEVIFFQFQFQNASTAIFFELGFKSASTALFVWIWTPSTVSVREFLPWDFEHPKTFWIRIQRNAADTFLNSNSKNMAVDVLF